MFYIDKYAYINNLKTVHPTEKFIFAVLTLILSVLTNSVVVSLTIFILMSLSALFLAKIPFSYYFKILLVPFYFLIFGIIPILFDGISTETYFTLAIFNFKFGINGISLLKSIHIFCKTMGSISCLFFLILTVPVSEIINILEKLKAPKLFLELMLLIYRFIFVLFDTSAKIQRSQISRLSGNNYKTRLRSAAKLLSSLFLFSLKKSDDIYNSLESRCYNGNIKFLGRKFTHSKMNIGLIILIEGLLITETILFWGKI